MTRLPCGLPAANHERCGRCAHSPVSIAARQLAKASDPPSKSNLGNVGRTVAQAKPAGDTGCRLYSTILPEQLQVNPDCPQATDSVPGRCIDRRSFPASVHPAIERGCD